MIHSNQIPNLDNNQNPKPSKNIYKYLFIISFILLLAITTTLYLALLKTKKILKSSSVTQKESISNDTNSSVVVDNNNTNITSPNSDSVLIYNYTYNPDGTKETEKVLKYNIANNSIQELQLDGYKVIDYYTYLSGTKYIFLTKDNQIFVYNISDSKITKTSLPDLKEDKNYQEKINLIAFSKDQNSVIFEINNYDKNDPGPDIGGGPEPLSSKEYIYNISENKTIVSSVLQKAEKLIQNNSYNIIGWDNKENILFVILYGNNQLFAKLNLDNNTVTKTSTKGFNSYSLSPSFKQVVVFDAIKDSISIYSTNDLDNVKKELNISQIKNKNDYNLTLLNQINWSPTENELALSFNQKIYTINVNSNQILLKYTDTTIGNGLLYWDRNNITYSSSGKFLFITDWDNTNQDDIDKGQDIYRTIKINRDTNTTEVITNTSLKNESSFVFGVTR